MPSWRNKSLQISRQAKQRDRSLATSTCAGHTRGACRPEEIRGILMRGEEVGDHVLGLQQTGFDHVNNAFDNEQASLPKTAYVKRMTQKYGEPEGLS